MHDPFSEQLEDHDICMEWSDEYGLGICYRYATVGGKCRNQFCANGGKHADANEHLNISKTDEIEVQMDFTDDLLHMVFSFMDLANLCRAAAVCRQWRAASLHDDFWRILNFENRAISIHQFEDILNRYPKATEVYIFGVVDAPLVAMKALLSLRNLQVLSLGKGHVGEGFFHVMRDCVMLRCLIINDAVLNSGGQDMHILHDRLRFLEVTKCRVLRISVRCRQLETLSMKRSNMIHVVLSCPVLRDLDMGSCQKLSDAAIHMAVTSCRHLESLDISNCPSVSDDTLRDIAYTCSNLRNLDASYCPAISLESVRLPMLTLLKLQSCDSITSTSMNAISHCHLLEVLELDDCSLLTSISLCLSRLHSVRLVHCRRFADLTLQCVMLSCITVSNCPLLNRISLSSQLLQKLKLQKQESLSMLELQCHGLEEADLADCESLLNSICEVFSDGGGCPVLRSLVLDNCECLSELRFSSTSLVTLSLAGCQCITSLELRCPSLEKVCLDGCDHLERAVFSPVGLGALNLGICPKLSVLAIEGPNMVSLELKGCGVLSEASIRCPRLTSLDASFCSQLRDGCLVEATVLCPQIETLILMSCSSVCSAPGLHSLHSLSNLRVLDLSYTFLLNLQPVFDSCLHLQVLKLQACKCLSQSSLDGICREGALPCLQELDLSYGTIGQAAIEKLLACCTRLTRVSLNGCPNMHNLEWREFRASSLEHLNCVGCPSMRRVVIPPAAGFLRLSSLSLSLSYNLREVAVSCPSLTFLNLSNCYALHSLVLHCPRLVTLFLQASSMEEAAIEVAIMHCHALETLDIRFCNNVRWDGMTAFRRVCPTLRRIFSSTAFPPCAAT